MLLQGIMLKKVLSKLLPLILGEIQGTFKPLQDYVYKPNEADKRIDKLEIDNFQLRERLNELEKKVYK
tara:strand:- start:471 stop:674 length:204 start_codon:yes stop_codon:yes gene_type:complete